MHAFKILAVTAAVAAALPASAATVNFDTLPGGATVPIGTSISTQYASLGVTFSGTINGSTTGTSGSPTATDYSGGPYNDYYARNYLANFDLPAQGYNFSLLAPRYDVVSLLFSTPVNNVSFGLNTFFTLGQATFTAYDASGAVLQNVVLSANGGWDLKSLSASNISRIDIHATTINGATTAIFGIDQLSFTPNPAAAVPEPASWATMIVGLGLAGAAMRRRTRVTVRFA